MRWLTIIIRTAEQMMTPPKANYFVLNATWQTSLPICAEQKLRESLKNLRQDDSRGEKQII
jgi:hypothetical protein